MSGYIYITFDLDWASDHVCSYLLDIVEYENIAATFFITHATPLLDRIRANPKLELAIHPNLNPLLMDDADGNSAAIVNELLSIVPEAVGIRTHALVQGTYLSRIYATKGLRYEANMYVPWQLQLPLVPYMDHNRLIQIPFFWEDDIHCVNFEKTDEKFIGIKALFMFSSLRVFNFHPIHIYLNTENITRYTECKKYLQDSSILKSHRNCMGTPGIAVFFLQLLQYVHKNGYRFGTLAQLAERSIRLDSQKAFFRR